VTGTWSSIKIEYPDGYVEAHAVPNNDLRDHYVSRDCWCRPDQLDSDYEVFVHHSLDGRESYEEGRKLS
jgi:hypothetical protein